MGLKIKLTDVNGVKRVDPETMDLLLRFKQHVDLCDECGPVFERRQGHYCTTGMILLQELCARPDVEAWDDAGQIVNRKS